MPEVPEDVQPDPILSQFMGMGRPELARECTKRGIPSNEPGSTAANLLAKLVEYEQRQADPTVVSDDEDPLGLDDDVIMDDAAPEPPATGMAASVPVAGPAAEGVVTEKPDRAAADPAPAPSSAPAPVSGTIGRYRKEFVVGDVEPSDEQHFSMIAKTHDAAREAGHTPRGGRWAGLRVGFGNRNGMRTAIYEVSVRRK